MSLIKHSPFVMDDLFAPLSWARTNFDYGNRHRIRETETSFEISVDVPGIKAKDLKVEAEENVLRIFGERKTQGSESTFVRSFSIDGKTMDISGVKANLDSGILTLIVPKRPQPTPKTIAITEAPTTTEKMAIEQK